MKDNYNLDNKILHSSFIYSNFEFFLGSLVAT